MEYNDFPTLWCAEKYREFLASENEILFVHIREPKEIEKLVRSTNGEAKTLLVRGGERMSKVHYGNSSDDEVENYTYTTITSQTTARSKRQSIFLTR